MLVTTAETALRQHQEFKREVVARLTGGFSMKMEIVDRWIKDV